MATVDGKDAPKRLSNETESSESSSPVAKKPKKSTASILAASLAHLSQIKSHAMPSSPTAISTEPAVLQDAVVVPSVPKPTKICKA